MGKPHPLALRERVVAFVTDGNTHRAAAAHFRVSTKFVNDMVILKRATGSLAPKRQGNPGRGKLSALSNWVQGRLEARGDLTLDELVLELHHEHEVDVHRASVGRGHSGSRGVNRSCATIWKGWYLLTRPHSRPI